jgi:hypothetical protein
MRPPFACPDVMRTLTNAFGKIDIAHCQAPFVRLREVPGLSAGSPAGRQAFRLAAPGAKQSRRILP